MNLPSNLKVVQAINPQTTDNAAGNSIYVSLKNVVKAWIVVNLTQAVGHATQLTPHRATAVAGTGAAVLTSAVKIWANEDTAAGDTLAVQTAAVNYSVAADVKNKVVVFEINPADIGAYDCINLGWSDSNQATNLISAVFVLQMKYAAAVPPSVIVD